MFKIKIGTWVFLTLFFLALSPGNSCAFASEELQKDRMIEALANDLPLLLNGKTEFVAQSYFSLSKYIFEHKSFPNLIFKVAQSSNGAGLDVQPTVKQEAELEFDVYDIKLVKIPKSFFFTMKDSQGVSWDILIEEKASIVPNYTYQKNLYESYFARCSENVALSNYFQELFYQLALSICITGFHDIHLNNIPLDHSTMTIVLVDIDSSVTERELRKSHALKGIVNLLILIDPFLVNTVIKAAAHYFHVSSLDMSNLLLSEICKDYFPLCLLSVDPEAIFKDILATASVIRKLRFTGMNILEYGLSYIDNNPKRVDLW